jgi:hypothetical protein
VGEEGEAGQSARAVDHDRSEASNDQLEKILSYIDIGKKEGGPN